MIDLGEHRIEYTEGKLCKCIKIYWRARRLMKMDEVSFTFPRLGVRKKGRYVKNIRNVNII